MKDKKIIFDTLRIFLGGLTLNHPSENMPKCFFLYMTYFIQRKDFWKLSELSFLHCLTQIYGFKIRFLLYQNASKVHLLLNISCIF